jgi:Transposase, Mutator family
LLIDGTYYGKDICLIVYRDNAIKFTQLYRLTDGEWYKEMKEDLQNLLSLNIQIESITCDGHTSLLKAIRNTCKEVVIQRCVIHVQRMCRIWLTMQPQTQPGRELRKIVNVMHRIQTPQESNIWIKQLDTWYRGHEEFVNEKSRNPLTGREWFKHKLLKRCVTVIGKALPNLFHYTYNQRIPKSTNGLESFFGHLKDNLRIHRGMTLEHRKNFIKWYLYFRNQESFKSHKTIPIDKQKG